MDNQPAFDRSLLIPIFISGCSIIGILGVLVLGRWLNAPPQVAMTPSATRFQYVYLGTEPVITTPLIEDTEIGPTEPVAIGSEEPTQIAATPGAPASPTRSTPPTLIILGSPTNNPQSTNTPTATVTSASGPPLNPGIYDDIYPQIIYNGWDATNAGSTLHVSYAPGSTISFRFIGTRLRLLYQGGSTLGVVRITIDNDAGASKTLDQSSGNEWPSDLLPNGTHSVLITHISGGPVNLDQIVIPEPLNTPTPTATRTPT